MTRRLLINSNPPGATVFVGDRQVGTTPCAVNYVYYGTRKIRMEKDGYQTRTIIQPLPTPWYQIPPVDFVSDVLVPYDIRDVRAVTYQMSPQHIVPDQHLMARAEQLRQQTQRGSVMPAGYTPSSPQSLAPNAATIPDSGQPIDASGIPLELVPAPTGQQNPPFMRAPGAETLPPSGLEAFPVTP